MLGLSLEFSRCSLRTRKAQCVVWVWVVPGQVVGRGSCGPGATGLCRVYWAGEEMVPWAGPEDTVWRWTRAWGCWSGRRCQGL